MSGFELFIILIIVVNVLAAVLKKRTRPKGQEPNQPPQRPQEEFDEDQSRPRYPDFGDQEINRTRSGTGPLEEIKEEASSLEARLGLEGDAGLKAPMAMAASRKNNPALQVVDLQHREPRILGLQSKSDLRRAVLLSEVLGTPRSLSHD